MMNCHQWTTVLLLFCLSATCQSFQVFRPPTVSSITSVAENHGHDPRRQPQVVPRIHSSSNHNRKSQPYHHATTLTAQAPAQNQKQNNSFGSSWIQHLWRKQTNFLSRFRRRVLFTAFSLCMVFSLHFSALAAPSGYRTGGTFRPSSSSSSSYSRPPIQRNYSPLRSRIHSRPLLSPQWTSLHYHNSGPRVIYGSSSYNAGVTVAEKVVMTGVGGLIVYGFVKDSRHRNNHNGRDMDATMGPLGYGATSTSITVAVDISDRSDGNSLLNRLQRISERADTSKREGIQQLVQEASLELLRHSDSITSMYVDSKHSKTPEQALRHFGARSIETRSKFDGESVDRFGGQNRQIKQTNDHNAYLSKATVGVITLNLAIEGSSTHLPSVRNRATLLDALQRIAADSVVDDCLFAAELLWVPANRQDVFTREELFRDFPNLLAI